MPSAQELYQTQVLHLSLAERLRLASLLLDDLKTLPSPASLFPVQETARPKRGSGKHDISYMADDFDASLEEMREYSE